MTVIQVVLLVEAFVFGLIVGSFLNVCIYRIPRKLSLLGRSFCPACKQAIPLYRNVPVLAFLWQRTKTKCCRTPISWQYPTIEVLTGFLSVVALWHSQDPLLSAQQNLWHYFIWFVLFLCPLLVVSVIDLQWRIIPDVISLPFILVGIAVQLFEFYPNVWGALKFSFLGILLGGGSLLCIAEIFSRLLKKDAMGGGDIKLAAMLGAFLGAKAMVFIFFASSVLAMLYFAALMLLGRASKDRLIPYGPFLSMAGMLYWLHGEAIIEAYLTFAKLR